MIAFSAYIGFQAESLQMNLLNKYLANCWSN